MGGCHLVTPLDEAFDVVTRGLDLLSAVLSPSSVLIDIMIVHFQVDGRRQLPAPLLPSSSHKKG